MKITDVLNIDVSGRQANIYISGIIGYPSDWQHEDSENIATTKEEMKKEIKSLSNISNRVSRINIYIDSPGGSIEHALAMYRALESHKAEKYTYYEGVSASAATIIGAISKKENTYIYSYLALLVHEARFGYIESTTASDLENDARNLRKFNGIIADLYSKQNVMSKEENLNLIAENNGEGRLLTANEALELGFVGNVLEAENRVAALNTDVLNKVGWSKNNINKLNKISNKSKSKKMGLFKKPSPAKILEIDNIKLLYRELKEGKDVEIVGSDEIYNGSFEHENKQITIEENKIVNVIEITENDKAENLKTEIEALKAEIEALKAETEEFKNEVIESFKDVSETIAENQSVLEAAKLKKSEPNLPKTEDLKEDASAKISAKDLAKKEMKKRYISNIKRKGGVE